MNKRKLSFWILHAAMKYDRTKLKNICLTPIKYCISFTKKDLYHFTYHQYYVLYYITIVVTLPHNVTSIVNGRYLYNVLQLIS